ncbi:DEAD/DEAH box helicase family protein [uncultured Methanobrevibacter sp.]|uniref:DEAD/DEAH box helicase family protein n=1 Tax=uncultured Methanobrevibacter sp. TaxID=253161 RepID=UPI002631A677|nr:DEAD/DEAH box helicase family protein [uncultured Methanobrevibacter sp.]
MSLKDVNIKIKYDSDEDDLLNDFYIPVLSQANEYYRLSGFFNSSSLAVSACGLENFIKHNGKMKLITSVIFSENDLNRINEAEENPLKVIEENFIKDLDNISDEFVKDHLAALGWMIAHDYLEIKVAYPKDLNSLFHPKVGILKDSNQNIVSFSGSDNETRSGWLSNIEEFKVFASWKSGHPEIIDSDINSFFKYWDNDANKVNVIEIPKAIKKDLIKLAPDNSDNLNFHQLPNYGGGSISKDERKLRFYQQDALDSWFGNGCRGIFELATGTGKTFTALKSLEKLYKREDIVCVIACPLIYLVEQWFKDIKNFPIFENVYRIYGTNANWKKQLNDFMFDLDLGIIDDGIIITTHNTFSNDNFIKALSSCNKKLCVIVDEMHHLGAEKFSEGLTCINYQYRLGLSATPSVYMNEEATDFLMDYFGGIVSSFTIKDALTNIDPETGEYYLAEYNYYPIRIELSQKEMEEYNKLSNMIRIEYFKDNDDSEKNLVRLLNKRRQILKDAKQKDVKLREILNKYSDIDHLIIFTTHNQKDRVLTILGEEGVSPRHEFTSNVGTKNIKEIGMNEREFLIDKFDKGNLKALVAIKCLDEGVDVPSADKVIIMSSSTNPMEYVQRRGRVLRKYKGKDVATIFDMVVLPEDDGFDATKTIKEAEIRKLYDFIESAKNKSDCYKILDEWGI